MRSVKGDVESIDLDSPDPKTLDPEIPGLIQRYQDWWHTLSSGIALGSCFKPANGETALSPTLARPSSGINAKRSFARDHFRSKLERWSTRKSISARILAGMCARDGTYR